jgi:hypothetical protein
VGIFISPWSQTVNPYHKTAMLYARAQELFHLGQREEALEAKRKADEFHKQITEEETKQKQTALQSR